MSRRTVAGIAALALVLPLSACGGADDAGWGSPERVPVPAAAAASVTASVDGAGGVHVAWPDKRAGRWSLRAVDRPPGGAWSAPETVAAGGPFGIWPHAIAANGRGDAAALWADRGGRRSVLLASVRRAGGGWGPEQAVSRVSGNLTFGQIAIDAHGAVTVTGRGLAGPGLWTVRRDPDGTWSAPVLLTPEGEGVDAPELVVAPDGRAAVVALLKRRGRPAAVWSATADAAGAWSSGEVVAGSEGARYPVVAITADGLVAGWTQQRAQGRPQRVMAARRSTAGWSPPVPLDAPSPYDFGPIQLVADGDGALAAWARWDGAPTARRGSIRARRIGPGGLDHAATVSPVTFPPVGGPGVHVIYLSPPVDLRAAPGATPTLLWSEPAGGTRAAGRRLVAARRDGDGIWRTERLGSAPGLAPLAGGDGAVLWYEAPPNAGATRIQIATSGG
jgi:hypothetical protein